MIALAINTLKLEMADLALDIDTTAIEKIAKPGNDSAKKVKVVISFRPASDDISLQGIPSEIRDEALAWLDREMQSVYEKNPFMKAVTKPIFGATTPHLERVEGINGVAWIYPTETPHSDGFKMSDFRVSVKSGESVDCHPLPEAGKKMPIPRDILTRFSSWLETRLFKEPGLYVISAIDGNRPQIGWKVFQKPIPQMIIYPSDLETISKLGVDIDAEAAELLSGTTNWSVDQLASLLDRIDAKLKEKGYYLTSIWQQKLRQDRKTFSTFKRSDSQKKDEGTYEILRRTLAHRLQNNPIVPLFKIYSPAKLIDPTEIQFTGDTDIAATGGKEGIAKIIGSQPLTEDELLDKLREVAAHYHSKGFRFITESTNKPLVDPLELNLKYNSKTNTNVATIDIKVMKASKIEIAGDIPMSGKEALLKGIPFKEGEPIDFNTLDKSVARSIERLNLLPGTTIFDMVYLTPSETGSEITIRIRKEPDQYRARLRLTGTSISVGGGTTLNHTVPGTQSATIDGNVGSSADGKISASGAVSATTLPLNDQGVSMSASVDGGRYPYWFVNSSDSQEEIGFINYIVLNTSINIPLGKSGIASMTDLSAGTSIAYSTRNGEKENGEKIDSTALVLGTDASLRAILTRFISDGDIAIPSAGGNISYNATDGTADTTLFAEARYAMPFRSGVGLSGSIEAKKRYSLTDGSLPIERLLGPGNLISIDFGRSLLTPYGSSFYARAGLFLTYRTQHLVPMLGVTLSTDELGDPSLGGGIAFYIPMIAMAFYFGLNHRGQVTAGLGKGEQVR